MSGIPVLGWWRRWVSVCDAELHSITFTAGRVMDFVDKRMDTSCEHRCAEYSASSVALVCRKRALLIVSEDRQLGIVIIRINRVEKEV